MWSLKRYGIHVYIQKVDAKTREPTTGGRQPGVVAPGAESIGLKAIHEKYTRKYQYILLHNNYSVLPIMSLIYSSLFDLNRPWNFQHQYVCMLIHLINFRFRSQPDHVHIARN